MSRKRFYTFEHHGEILMMTLEDAFKIKDDAIQLRIQEILNNLKTRKMKHDGFVAGYQENIKMNVGGRREYDRILKEKGLVEVGYDFTPKEYSPNINPCANEAFALEAKKVLDISDSEVDAIKSGEFFKKEGSDV